MSYSFALISVTLAWCALCCASVRARREDAWAAFVYCVTASVVVGVSFIAPDPVLVILCASMLTYLAIIALSQVQALIAQLSPKQTVREAPRVVRSTTILPPASPASARKI